MKKCIFIALFCILIHGLYPQQAIDSAELIKLVTVYLEDTFQKYMKPTNLRVSEIKAVPDTERSTGSTTYYFIEGRFLNYPIDRRVLSGRLEATVAVETTTSLFGKSSYRIPLQQEENILLLVDDLLSDELRDSYVVNYINQNYNRPLDISIKRERVEIYPDSIISYVSAVVNMDSITFLRVVFEMEESIEQRFPNAGVHIKSTQWKLRRSDEIFSAPFPDKEQIRADAREDLFARFGDIFKKGYGKTWEYDWTSGIKKNSISRKELFEASDGLIKLDIDFQYDYGRFLKWSKYLATARILYQFDFENGTWKYLGIEIISYVAQ